MTQMTDSDFKNLLNPPLDDEYSSLVAAVSDLEDSIQYKVFLERYLPPDPTIITVWYYGHGFSVILPPEDEVTEDLVDCVLTGVSGFLIKIDDDRQSKNN